MRHNMIFLALGAALAVGMAVGVSLGTWLAWRIYRTRFELLLLELRGRPAGCYYYEYLQKFVDSLKPPEKR